jgi:hypothetical protein
MLVRRPAAPSATSAVRQAVTSAETTGSVMSTVEIDVDDSSSRIILAAAIA